MKEKELSIIIPYHNNVDYLEKLLNSIKHFDKIEVIVVNDYSDKNLHEYENLKSLPEYSEVLFLDNKSKNRGAGVGRNIGLENATGKWLLFADSDDYFVDGFYDVVKNYFDSEYEVIFFTPTSKDLDTGEIADRHLFMKREIEDYLKDNSKVNEFQIRYYFYTPWSKLIKRELVEKNKIRFHEVVAKNDSYFSVSVGHYMKKFAVSKEIIYCATWHSKGNVTKRKDEKFVVDSTKSRIKLMNFLKEKLSKEDLKILRYNNIAYYFVESLKKQKIDSKYIKMSIEMFKKSGFSVYNKDNIVPRIKYFIKSIIGLKK